MTNILIAPMQCHWQSALLSMPSLMIMMFTTSKPRASNLDTGRAAHNVNQQPRTSKLVCSDEQHKSSCLFMCKLRYTFNLVFIILNNINHHTRFSTCYPVFTTTISSSLSSSSLSSSSLSSSSRFTISDAQTIFNMRTGDATNI